MHYCQYFFKSSDGWAQRTHKGAILLRVEQDTLFGRFVC